jgi:hypothetical protein
MQRVTGIQKHPHFPKEDLYIAIGMTLLPPRSKLEAQERTFKKDISET